MLYRGSAYVAVQASTGQAPDTSPAYWLLVVQGTREVIAKAKRAGAYPAALQSLANSTESTIVFDAYDFTRDTWAAVGNVITPPVAGVWQVRAYCLFYAANSAADTTGGRQLTIKRQTTNAVLSKDSKPAFGPLNVGTACGCETTIDMSAGTFGVYCTAYQTSGVALPIEPYLTLEYRGP